MNDPRHTHIISRRCWAAALAHRSNQSPSWPVKGLARRRRHVDPGPGSAGQIFAGGRVRLLLASPRPVGRARSRQPGSTSPACSIPGGVGSASEPKEGWEPSPNPPILNCGRPRSASPSPICTLAEGSWSTDPTKGRRLLNPQGDKPARSSRSCRPRIMRRGIALGRPSKR